jgi:hypothetical protein
MMAQPMVSVHICKSTFDPGRAVTDRQKETMREEAQVAFVSVTSVGAILRFLG